MIEISHERRAFAFQTEQQNSSSANTTGASDEQNTDSAGQQSGQAASPSTTPSTFEQRRTAAGDDPAQLKALLDEYDGALKTTRHEAMTRRQAEADLSTKLTAYENAQKERERAEMTDLQKAQDDLKNYETKLAAAQKELAASQAKTDFLEAGASDIDSVTALWQLLPDEERGKQKPKEWAATLKADKPHLFGTANAPGGFGGNHRQDEGGNQGGNGAPMITHPESLKDINQVMADFDRMFSN